MSANQQSVHSKNSPNELNDNTNIQSFLNELHLAAQYGVIDWIKNLANSNGFNINARIEHGNTALHVALFYNQIEAAKTLLALKADVNAQNSEGYTPLHVAAQLGMCDVIQDLVSKGAVIDAKIDKGFTPLHVAIHFKQLDAAKTLLKLKADVNAIEARGWTPLHLAASEGLCDFIHELATKDAIIDAKTNSGGFTAFYIAICRKQIKAAWLLLSLKADINAVADNGFTTLHMAAAEGSNDILIELISKDAAVDAKTKTEGYSALHMAINNKKLDIAKTLLSLKLDVNSIDNNGWTALHHAAEHGSCDLIQELVLKGAAINAKTKIESGLFTALHISIANNQTDAAKSLLALNADSNSTDGKRRTPLHMATTIGNCELTQELISRGVDINAKCELNLNSLHLALQTKQIDTAKALLAHKIDVTSVDEYGRTALDFAMSKFIFEIIPELLANGLKMEGNTLGNLILFAMGNESKLDKDLKLKTKIMLTMLQSSSFWTNMDHIKYLGIICEYLYLKSGIKDYLLQTDRKKLNEVVEKLVTVASQYFFSLYNGEFGLIFETINKDYFESYSKLYEENKDSLDIPKQFNELIKSLFLKIIIGNITPHLYCRNYEVFWRPYIDLYFFEDIDSNGTKILPQPLPLELSYLVCSYLLEDSSIQELDLKEFVLETDVSSTTKSLFSNTQGQSLQSILLVSRLEYFISNLLIHNSSNNQNNELEITLRKANSPLLPFYERIKNPTVVQKTTTDSKRIEHNSKT